ncbi:uncharacterized protein MONOS_14820 [Monocercomonoides exilis]|uniref:uncharacterized protein n=1 Tax=Monocercomonoides exilis TaxID=2049356 RepID=UPI00355A1AE2|nr:hypothetical protein MONOS_14820 [Monocercomonoides exilis]|eukprot:MONOS_14820.1-p1 / transcript=MONOS_14820.1 / gene=MONOS_14820 / organism=Monocercomonoides_exilis_PA203 / gene_product=unspecified product / transcript_product=unspecified product / location=Mono_scaffold01080:8113-9550(+) / protein_length=422 / sequence_SO=supercontig / SO=protein_coding / is_pseudo=false
MIYNNQFLSLDLFAYGSYYYYKGLDYSFLARQLPAAPIEKQKVLMDTMEKIVVCFDGDGIEKGISRNTFDLLPISSLTNPNPEGEALTFSLLKLIGECAVLNRGEGRVESSYTNLTKVLFERVEKELTSFEAEAMSPGMHEYDDNLNKLLDLAYTSTLGYHGVCSEKCLLWMSNLLISYDNPTTDDRILERIDRIAFILKMNFVKYFAEDIQNRLIQSIIKMMNSQIKSPYLFPSTITSLLSVLLSVANDPIKKRLDLLQQTNISLASSAALEVYYRRLGEARRRIAERKRKIKELHLKDPEEESGRVFDESDQPSDVSERTKQIIERFSAVDVEELLDEKRTAYNLLTLTDLLYYYTVYDRRETRMAYCTGKVQTIVLNVHEEKRQLEIAKSRLEAENYRKRKEEEERERIAKGGLKRLW